MGLVGAVAIVTVGVVVFTIGIGLGILLGRRLDRVLEARARDEAEVCGDE